MDGDERGMWLFQQGLRYYSDSKRGDETMDNEAWCLEAAVEMWKGAADLGVADAQCNLGSLYMMGEGVGRDLETAWVWFAKASQQQHPKGQYNLGLLELHGLGVDEHREHAKALLEEAEKGGHTEAGVLLRKVRREEVRDMRCSLCLMSRGEVHDEEEKKEEGWVTFACEHSVCPICRKGSGLERDDGCILCVGQQEQVQVQRFLSCTVREGHGAQDKSFERQLMEAGAEVDQDIHLLHLLGLQINNVNGILEASCTEETEGSIPIGAVPQEKENVPSDKDDKTLAAPKKHEKRSPKSKKKQQKKKR